MLKYLLLIESSTPATSIGLVEYRLEADKATPQRTWFTNHESKMRHTANLLPTIKQVLSDANVTLDLISTVAVNLGPGSYTGLRSGLSTAQGLCMSLNIPIIGIGTLEAIALKGLKNKTNESFNEIIAVLPARKQEIYFQRFDRNGNPLSKGESAELNEHWKLKHNIKDKALVGQLPETLADNFNDSMFDQVNINSETMVTGILDKISKNKYDTVESLVPLYIKAPYITVAKSRLHPKS